MYIFIRLQNFLQGQGCFGFSIISFDGDDPVEKLVHKGEIKEIMLCDGE